MARAAQDSYDSLNPMHSAQSGDDLYSAFKQSRNTITHAWEREKAAILSAGIFAPREEVQKSLRQGVSSLDAVQKVLEADSERLYQQLSRKQEFRPRPIAPTDEEKRLGRIIPVRSPDFVCPLQTGYLVDKLGAGSIENIRLRGNLAYEALNFVDGKRSVTEIALAVSAEFGPSPLQDYYEYFKVLEQAELIRLDLK